MKQRELFSGIPGEPKKGKKDMTIREWKVPSFTSEKEYLVRQEGRKWICMCPSYVKRKKACKHIQRVKEKLGLVKADLSGYKSALQKSLRRGDLSLLKLSFQQLWEKDKRWVIWRLPILAGEEVESCVGLTGRLQGNATREAVWELLVRMALSSKSKECEGLRVASHIITEEGWRPEDSVQGERLFQLKSWMDVQTKFQAAGKNKRPFWEWFEKHFQVADRERYVQETFSTAKRRSGQGGMKSDIELMLCIAWMCMVMPWAEQELVMVPSESEIKESESLPWFIYDGHTSIGRLIHAQLRKVIPDKEQWRYVTDDLQFNMESARCDRLTGNSFWWPFMVNALWRRYGRTPEEAERDWQVWRPRIKALVEKEMVNQHG